MTNNDIFAKAAYQAYSEQAGGKPFDGKPLPTYDALGAERKACWLAAAKAVELMTLGASINMLTHTYNLVASDNSEVAVESASVQH